MKEESKYIIQFSGLAEEEHHFKFDIAKDFLENFEQTEINDLNIKVDTVMEKTSRHLAFEFKFAGIVDIPCDRCLEMFDISLDFDCQLYVTFGDETSDLTDIDDRMVLSRKEDKIDLTKHFYDYINLQIPLQRIHPEGEDGESTCDSKMLDNLEKYMGTKSATDKSDPRWDKLKNLYN